MITVHRPLSKKWIQYWFPQYIINGKPLHLTRKYGFIKGKRRTKETTPWRFVEHRPNGEDINIRGYRTRAVDIPKAPYVKYVKEPVTAQEYEAFMKTLNYFANGEQGLNPHELIGGWRGAGESTYRCANGIYQPRPPRFVYFDNRPDWIG